MIGIFYQGPSMIDGSPIVGIATEGSKNTKTGPMVQTWILRADREPHLAALDGSDAAICGTCPHRYDPGTGARTCYVTTHQAPLSVYRRWKRGAYPHLDGRGFETPLRLGSYGDPGALPYDVVADLVSRAPLGHTGYTHRWRDRPDLRSYLMASTDSYVETQEATALGWRTFRVRANNGALFSRVRDGGLSLSTPREIECLSAIGRTCADCRLCAGAQRPAASIWIAAHGVNARKVGRALPVVGV